MHVHPETGIVSPFCPDGRFTHVPPAYPSAEWDNRFEFPWWSDCSLAVGRLSVSERPIRLVNTLTRQEHIMKVSVWLRKKRRKREKGGGEELRAGAKAFDSIKISSFVMWVFVDETCVGFCLLFFWYYLHQVCTEESLEEILCRAISYNAHGGSYTWKYLGRVLDMGMCI